MTRELGPTEIIDQNEGSIRPLLRRLLEHLGAVTPENTGDIVAILDLDQAQP